MKRADDFEPPAPSYDVEDPSLGEKIDALMQQLQPDSNADLLREIFVTGVKLAQENSSRGDLKILRTSVKEMRYAFKVFSRYRDISKVAVFGSARSRPDSPEYQTALQFSRRISRLGYMIITGAGDGIMAAGNQGAGRERSFGLNITLPFEQSANPTISGDEKLINFRYFFTRKLFFVKESDAIVLMPGGFGTQDEGFETLTLLQTGKSEPIPLVLLDRPGGAYWKGWSEFFETHLVKNQYVSPEERSLFFITDSVEEACREITDFYRRYHSSRYVNRRQQLVLRLKEAPGEDLVGRLNERFGDILLKGSIEPCGPFPEEEDEPELKHLPRLVLAFDQHHFGRLRRLIDAINEA